MPLIGTVNPERIAITAAADLKLTREEWYHRRRGEPLP
jgi:predicted oxidoreductase